MSDIIRGLRHCTAEQEQRETLRAMNRIIRSVRNAPVPSPSFTPPPRPQFPGGIVPVFVINQPFLRR